MKTARSQPGPAGRPCRSQPGPVIAGLQSQLSLPPHEDHSADSRKRRHRQQDPQSRLAPIPRICLIAAARRKLRDCSLSRRAASPADALLQAFFLRRGLSDHLPVAPVMPEGAKDRIALSDLVLSLRIGKQFPAVQGLPDRTSTRPAHHHTQRPRIPFQCLRTPRPRRCT